MGGTGNRVAALRVCLTQPILKNKGCIYMQAQCHGCHSAGLLWAFGAQMNNFILNNSSCQPEDPSQLTGSFTAFRGERSTGYTWIIRKGKIVENSRGSLSRQRDVEVLTKGHISSVPISPCHSAYNFSRAFPQGWRKEEGYCLAVINFSVHRCSGNKKWDQRNHCCSDGPIKAKKQEP